MCIRDRYFYYCYLLSRIEKRQYPPRMSPHLRKEIMKACLLYTSFTGIGRGLKDGSPFAMTLPCCLTNGAEGYYPMKEAYDEGGYEARSSNFKAGIAELLIDCLLYTSFTIRSAARTQSTSQNCTFSYTCKTAPAITRPMCFACA